MGGILEEYRKEHKEEDLEIVFTGDTKEFMLLAKGGACYINSIKVYFKE